jgi:class 3 adenylate cyclase
VRAAAAWWAAVVAVPAAGLALLLAAPRLDLRWEDHPAHLWVVLAVGAVTHALGLLTGDAARRRLDARAFLLSLVFVSAAGFLVLHALATPGVFVGGPNAGFVAASAVGLLVGAVFAAVSTVDFRSGPAAAIVRRRRFLELALVAVIALWAGMSLAELPPLRDPLDSGWPLKALGAAGLVLYGLAAWRYLAVHRRRPAFLLLAVVAAFVLLVEAMAAVAFSRSWHLSWWEWHLLMLAAFGLVAAALWHEKGLGGSLDDLFAPVYGEPTWEDVREVSVLFADLEGFTGFAEGRDPTEVRGLVNAYLREAVPVIVAETGGRVEKYVGDAIMAVFDGPGHPFRAARAGLLLQERAAAVAAENPGWPRFRVGISTGRAVVGLVGGPGHLARETLGDTVNVASRLEAYAHAGEVVVGSRVRDALGEAALVGPAEELKVRNRVEPVRAYVLRGLAPGSEGDERLQAEEQEA